MKTKKRKFKCTGCGDGRPCYLESNQETSRCDDMMREDFKCVLDETNQTSYDWVEIGVDDWISVKDKLPEKGIDVLCFHPKCFSEVSDQTWKERILMGHLLSFAPTERSGFIDLKKIGDKVYSLKDGGTYWGFPYVCHQNFVTHWQPLPGKPKNQGDESEIKCDMCGVAIGLTSINGLCNGCNEDVG